MRNSALPDSKFIVHSTTLKCHNLHKDLPVLRLGPVKLEIHSEQPLVASFHDFMGPGECETMKDRGRNKMKATPLTVPKNSQKDENQAYTDRRVSKIRYLSHKLDQLAWRVNQRISDALEFDLNGLPIPAENFQLMNYGIGDVLCYGNEIFQNVIFVQEASLSCTLTVTPRPRMS